MQDSKTWNMLSQYLSGEYAPEQKEAFLKCIDENEKNKALYLKMKSIWEDEKAVSASIRNEMPLTFIGRFSMQKMKNFVVNQALGNLVGFTIGMWVTASFSHQVLERRSIHNLFGLAGRKKVEVNDIPEWLQNGIAIIAGFIVLEIINHFFQTKKHVAIWLYLKGIVLTDTKN
jgi:hypothetical protein